MTIVQYFPLFLQQNYKISTDWLGRLEQLEKKSGEVELWSGVQLEAASMLSVSVPIADQMS